MGTTDIKLTLQKVSTESDPVQVPFITSVSFDGENMLFKKMAIELPPGGKLYAVDEPPFKLSLQIPGISQPPSSPK